MSRIDKKYEFLTDKVCPRCESVNHREGLGIPICNHCKETDPGLVEIKKLGVGKVLNLIQRRIDMWESFTDSLTEQDLLERPELHAQFTRAELSLRQLEELKEELEDPDRAFEILDGRMEKSPDVDVKFNSF
jgi:ribosomal protein L37AE/L43A